MVVPMERWPGGRQHLFAITASKGGASTTLWVALISSRTPDSSCARSPGARLINEVWLLLNRHLRWDGWHPHLHRRRGDELPLIASEIIQRRHAVASPAANYIIASLNYTVLNSFFF